MDAREGLMIIPDLILARDAAIGLTAGLLAGLVHFSSLWWNTRLLMSERAEKAILLQLARFAVAVGTLAILAWFGAVALLAGALGFLLARQLLLERFGESR
jgi:F1F0 ATPase subunit 2